MIIRYMRRVHRTIAVAASSEVLRSLGVTLSLRFELDTAAAQNKIESYK